MAFQTNTKPVNNDAPITSGREQYKPDGYINISMPTREGGKRKLGAIKLHLDKPLEKQLLDHIADAGSMEEVMQQLAARLVLDFQRADGQNGAELDL